MIGSEVWTAGRSTAPSARCTLACMRMEAVLPEWATWCVNPGFEPWTVGIEEEVMLLEPDGSPAWRSEDVLRELPDSLAEHTRGETHGLALELATDPHRTVGEAASQLRQLRAGLADAVRGLGLRAAVAGTHPMVRAEDVAGLARAPATSTCTRALRELARREPTFALHVHVAVPDPELAVRAFNGMRAHIPVLLALAANSPFTRGRDSGLASARTPVFQAFPRTGIPREFATYAEYAEAIDVLIRCGAIPEPTFIWWDVRLQPKLGTLEVRVMDAQTRIRDTAALVALVQCLVRLRGARRHGRAGAARTRPRCSTRTASWPRATASTRSCSTRSATAACPPPGAWRRWSTPAGRTRARSAASAS